MNGGQRADATTRNQERRMAGRIKETDPETLAARCESFMKGARRLYDGKRLSGCKGDMWFFELFHHLNDCANALREAKNDPWT